MKRVGLHCKFYGVNAYQVDGAVSTHHTGDDEELRSRHDEGGRIKHGLRLARREGLAKYDEEDLLSRSQYFNSHTSQA